MVRVIQGQLDQGRGRRIAVIAYTEYPSDARVRWEAETLVGAGHKVFAIGLRPKSGPSPAELSGVQVYDVPLRACRGSKMRYVYQYAIFFLLSSVLLLRLHLRERFDVIYVHSLPDFQVFCALPLKIARIPVLLDLHEAMPEIFAARFQKSRESSWFRVFAALERMSCFFADHVISANDGIRSLLVTRRVPASHITTLYNVYEPVPRSVSSEEVRTRLRLPEGRLLVHAGGISPERDLTTLIEAVALLRGHADLHLVIAGDGAPGYIETLRNLVHRRGLEHRVSFLPKMPLEFARDLVSLSEVGVVTLESNPLTQVAWPTRLVEFVAHSKPLVVPQLPLIAAVLGDSARYYLPGDAVGLAEALDQVLKNRITWESRTQKAARACQEFDAKRARIVLLETLQGVGGHGVRAIA